ncbi:hypothetical protein ACFL6E_03560 [Candidatus Neomarinimicrobiota bacterium]
MAIQINTQNLAPTTVAALPVQPSGRKYSTQPNTNPAFILSGPTPDDPDVYTPSAQNQAAELDALLAMHGQQQNASDYVMGTIRDSNDLSGLRDPFATIANGEVPSFEEPKGAAIDYLIGASSGSSGGAGDIFSLALTANGQGMETVNLSALAGGSSTRNLPPNDALAQMVLDVQQSNLNTLLSIGGNSSSTNRGFSDMI